tara:strand:- start:3089 stop:3484 length:396 start_codon:yes stop_codon:yes gene_type:complete
MRFRREEEDDFSFDMTPMIDVVFLLIIFFMVSTVFVDFSRRMDISLPTSKASVQDETRQNLVIEMTLSKLMFLNGVRVTQTQLQKELKKLSTKKPPTAIIKADKGLLYGDVVMVMGVLQSSNIKDISVAVK